METSNFCINCKHCAGTLLPQHWQQIQCTHPALNIVESFNPVLGVPYKSAEYCFDVRMNRELCSVEGKWYEPSHSRTYVESLLSSPAVDMAPAKEITKPNARGKKITLDDLL